MKGYKDLRHILAKNALSNDIYENYNYLNYTLYLYKITALDWIRPSCSLDVTIVITYDAITYGADQIRLMRAQFVID